MSINREQLTQIIEADRGNNWWRPDLFEKKVQPILPSELRVVSPPPKQERNYNCFVFVFNLQNDPEFLGSRNPIQQKFVKYLIACHALVSVAKPDTNDLVFYKNNADEITHGGILKSKDIVTSKWMWGPTIVHGLWDVPSSFGNQVLFFKALNQKLVKEKYLDLYKTHLPENKNT